MRKLQNLRQPTIKGNEWQRTNAERQKLSKETAKTSKRTNPKKTKSLTFETTSNAPLATLHRLHKTQFNTISTETVATETVKTTSKFYNKKTKLHETCTACIKYTACTSSTSSQLAKDTMQCTKYRNSCHKNRETTITYTAGTLKKIFKQKRHGYRAFWCDFQKNCQADKNRVVTVCRVTQKPNYCFARSMYSPVRVSMRM